MGVYIKGMEMPDVKDFPFECFFRCVNYTNTKFVIKKDGEEQVYDLVEIPEPHGRLVDYETIDVDYWEDADGYHISVEAETVIEAEGE